MADLLRRLAEPRAGGDPPWDGRPARRSEKREPLPVAATVEHDGRDTGQGERNDRLACQDRKREEHGREHEPGAVAAIERKERKRGQRERERLRQVTKHRDDETGIEAVCKGVNRGRAATR